MTFSAFLNEQDMEGRLLCCEKLFSVSTYVCSTHFFVWRLKQNETDKMNESFQTERAIFYRENGLCLQLQFLLKAE